MSTVTAPPRLLTERSGLELADAIRSGETTSREVVEAHIERLQAVQPLINAVAAERFDAARAEADAADEKVRWAEGEADALPPFHGVPCTIKESFALQGMPNCAGVVGRRDHRSDTDAPTVARLRAAGAVPLGATNTSELCVWIESHNFVYGRTRNPYDPRRIAGGSSGGEGAAIGAGGSPFGLGSDIAGSIRLPAFFNGIFGHKPSPWLVPNTGQYPCAHGEASRLLSVGPLARRAEDLMPLLRILAGPDGEDEYTREVELGDPDEVDLDGLPVLLPRETSVKPVSKGLQRARHRAAAALVDAGADVREISLRAMRRALETFFAVVQQGAEETVRDLLDAQAGPGGSPSALRAAWGALRGRGPHTVATALLLVTEAVGSRTPERRTDPDSRPYAPLMRAAGAAAPAGRPAAVTNRSVGRQCCLSTRAALRPSTAGDARVRTHAPLRRA